MRFDVSIAHEAACTRVGIIGEPALGRLLSLLAVLEVDSVSWPRRGVLLDLRGLRTPLAPEEQARLAREAARSLWRMPRIAVVPGGADAPAAPTVQFFDAPGPALHWLEAVA